MSARVVLLSFASCLVVGCSVAFVVVADDKGSAAIGALSFLVTGLLTVAVAPEALRRFMGRGHLAGGELREALLARVDEQHGRALLTLPRESARAELRIGEVVRITTREGRAGSTADLAAIFDEAGGRFALVGEPGSGKTTAANLLLQSLLERARGSPSTRVPVLFQLAAWTERGSPMRVGRRPSAPLLEEWLVDRLATFAGVTRREARSLIPSIVPILDGLDEVATEYRPDCAREIERFVEQYPGAQVVITCRRREYDELTAKSRGALAVQRIEPLTPADLQRYFEAADATHWAPLIAELQRSGSLVAEALSTPLMLAVTLERWHNDDPRALVTAAVGTVERIRSRLWEQWLERAERRTLPGGAALACALAHTALTSGASEVRLERLGTSGTRRAWWCLKLVVLSVAVVAVASPFPALLATSIGLVNATALLAERLVTPRVRSRTERVEAVILSTLYIVMCLVIGLAVPLLAFLIGPLTVAVAFGGAVVLANPVVEGSARIRRWLPDPFRAARLSTGLVLAAFSILCFALSRVLDEWEAALAWACAVTLAWPESDYVGHLWLARGWYRLRGEGGSFRARVGDLVAAGYLRATGDAYRFFHLELQDHLGESRGARDAYRLENVDVAWLLTVGARRHRDAGSPEAARLLYERAVAADPRNVLVLTEYALFLAEEQGDAEGASEQFERAVEADPNRALTLSEFARHLGRQGELDRAERYFERAVGADPRDPVALGQYALFRHMTLKDSEGAELLYDRALKASPRNTANLNNYALLLTDLNRHDRAEELWKRALETIPHDMYALRNYGRFLAEIRDDPVRAAELYERALEVAPGDSSAVRQYVELLGARGDHDRAEAVLERALALEPRAAADAWPYVDALLAKDEVDRARRLMARIADSVPDDVAELSFQAESLLDHGEPGRARELGERAVELAPDDWRALAASARILASAGESDRAREHYERAVRSESVNGPVLGNLASMLDAQGETDRAGELYERAAEKAPYHEWILGMYAAFAARQRNPERARELYERAVALPSVQAETLVGFASFLYSQGARDEAVELFERSIAAEPGDAELLTMYALMESEHGDLDHAEQLFGRAIDADPDDVVAVSEYAFFLRLRRDDVDGAERLFARAIELAPEYAAALGAYALLLADDRGDQAGAARLFGRAVEADPENANNLGNYARLLCERCDDEEAAKLVERALALEREPPLSLELWFYSWIMGAPRPRDESLAELARLVADGVRTPGWNLERVVARAEALAHPAGDRVPLVAQVVNDEAAAGVLADWDDWSEAMSRAEVES
ncbi:MAG: tetratricopeptide repeat protein [Thermoleophilia bacterium]|nr:tetratricopeptide repeat protein [Thermoleophilia bacterium]